ncbi:hypothetical protein [Pseudomonas oryzihabitans]|uniref:hypothetical protein n=1 Tax=Pseudomonas oryzihabitans TaxID=47885 RepID=UPI003EC0C313
MDNVDWKERLLCEECEIFVSNRYEVSQIRFLRNGRLVVRHPNRITFTEFNYRKFYIFWLSILWRTSISSHPAFKGIELGADLDSVLRKVILSEDMSLHPGHCISEFITVGLLKIKPFDFFTDDTLKNMLMTIHLPGRPKNSSMYMIVEGFLVCFHFKTSEGKDMAPEFGRVKKSRLFRMPIVALEQSEALHSIFYEMNKYARHHGGNP